MSTWKLRIRGILYAGMGLVCCFGGGLLAYRTVQLRVAGVAGQAVVTEYLGEVTTRRSGAKWTNHKHVIAFDGRTLERQIPQRHSVGDVLEIIYVPGTNNLTLVEDDEPTWGLVVAGGCLILFGLAIGTIGYWILSGQIVAVNSQQAAEPGAPHP